MQDAHQYPALARFGREISDVLAGADSESFWLCEEAFRRLLASDFLLELADGQLATCFGNVLAIQALKNNFGRIAAPLGLTIDVILVEAANSGESLLTYPSHLMLGTPPMFDHSELTVELLAFDGDVESDNFDASQVMRAAGTTVFDGGNPMRIQAGRETFRIVSTGSTVPLVVLQSRPVQEFAWQIAADTLRPVQLISPKVSAYRLYYATQLLGHFPSGASADALDRLSRHPSHYVRWAALQALFPLDHLRAELRLRETLDDPHPSIRRSAEKAIARLEAWSMDA
jgi:hypothetical protein